MATLSELCADVYTLTNRPDLVAETKLAVKMATLKAHQSDYYPKDIFESGISFSEANTIQSIDYKAIVPRYRAFKYLRRYDAGTPGIFIDMLTPEETLDRYAVNRENICYLAGTQIEVRCSEAISYALFACYVHPVITDDGYSSWVADEHPYYIVLEAASHIFKTIGWDEQAAKYDRAALEQLTILRNGNILAQGY